MFGYQSLMAFGVSLVVLPCEGLITSPPDKEIIPLLKGSTANLTWSFDNDLSKVLLRAWYFTSSDGVFNDELLGSVFVDDRPSKITSLFDVAIEKPGTLVLNNINHTYDGTYKFVVDGKESTVVVYIAKKPTVTLNCSSPVELNKGENLTCLCKGEGGNPPANVTWCKDGVKITDVGKEKQTLKIRNATISDNGTYTCVATSYDHPNYTDKKSIEVIVYVRPNVSINCSNTSVNEGDDVTCKCKCEGGNPPADCAWFKNRAKRVKTGKEDNMLSLLDIKRVDSGIYTCIGESHSSARDEKSTTVTVYYVTVGISVINGLLTVTCTTNGAPLRGYKIHHNDSEVARNMTYNTSPVNWTHSGLYNCTATNNLGKLFDSQFLSFNDIVKKPTPPITPSSTTRAVPSSSISPGVTPDGDDGKNIGLIVGASGGAVVFIVIIACVVVYFKSKGRENKRGNADVDPNGSRVITNNYELEEEDHGGDAGAYDTVKQSDDGEGSQGKKKPAGASLPPVYAAVNKENRDGNTLYASLDSDALKKPGSKKKPPETRNTQTEYASIDFMQTGKTPNADNALT